MSTNNFFGNTFNEQASINQINIENFNFKDHLNDDEVPTYKPEPVWRSPFTLAVLNWVSFFTSLFSGGSIFWFFFDMTKTSFSSFNWPFLIVFLVACIMSIVAWRLRTIAKRQTRHPLVHDFAVSGLGHVITLEKIQATKCPVCGGNLKYYNKPVEWHDILKADGSIKRVITKRIPALECERDPDNHWWEVPPADSHI